MPSTLGGGSGGSGRGGGAQQAAQRRLPARQEEQGDQQGRALRPHREGEPFLTMFPTGLSG